MQTYVVHQADAGREYLITMRALQLLAPSLHEMGKDTPKENHPKNVQNIKTLWLTLGSGSPGLVLVMLIPLCPSSNKISE